MLNVCWKANLIGWLGLKFNLLSLFLLLPLPLPLSTYLHTKRETKYDKLQTKKLSHKTFSLHIARALQGLEIL